jgi:tetratricopeptide (TPR) repeat protein
MAFARARHGKTNELGDADLVEIAGQLKRVVEMSPDHDVAWGLLGLCELDRKRWDEAAVAFGEALKRNPRDWFCRLHLGSLRRIAGMTDVALNHLKLVVERADDPRMVNLAREEIGKIEKQIEQEGQ